MNSCTLFPDGTWSKCCDLHDYQYLTQKVSRKQADKILYDCVKSKCKVIAHIMYIGVRMFGWYFWNKNKKDKM